MSVKIMSAGISGIVGEIVTVEVDISRGLPGFNIVGLGDMSVKESKERVRSAILNSGFEFPVCRITVNLAPADLKKEGSLFDLPIAAGILLATKQISADRIKKFLFIGELSLSGEIKSVKGALPIAIEALRNDYTNLVVPLENAEECSITKLSVFAFLNLREMVHFIESGSYKLLKHKKNISNVSCALDFNEVFGQESAKRALEIAAAGFHNIVLYGPPGAGKTMLAKRLPSILPELSYEEALEVTQIYSVSGNLNHTNGLINSRPFRSPHHTCSRIAMAGGGSKLMPGEISLAHNGILFLDEMPEFRKEVLEVLRQPIEEKYIKIARATGNVYYPANFMLVGALNPCPCGNFGSNKECTCTDYQRKIYLKKISGPLMDRIDIIVSVGSVPFNKMDSNIKIEKSDSIRKRVDTARDIQLQRFKGNDISYNSQMDERQLNKYCILNNSTKNLMEKIYNKFGLSTRAYSRILKVARTIADINQRDTIDESDIIETLNYRRFIDEKIV